MKSSEIGLFIFFWVLLIADCILLSNGLHEYRFYTKTLLVPVLLIAIFNASKDTKHRRSRTIGNLAFFFCFLGDLLLLNADTDSSYFIAGLSSFLVAHLFFIIFFYRLKPFSDKYRLYLFAWSFLIFGYVAFLLFLIWSGVSRQNMEAPVAAYGFILGCMLLTAVNSSNNKSIKRLSVRYFIPGALLFVISDSILALNKFAITTSYGSITVMVTYASAIFVLALGMIRFLKK